MHTSVWPAICLSFPNFIFLLNTDRWCAGGWGGGHLAQSTFLLVYLQNSNPAVQSINARKYCLLESYTRNCWFNASVFLLKAGLTITMTGKCYLLRGRRMPLVCWNIHNSEACFDR